MESLKSVYKISINTRNFEISHLIQRNNFFMLFQGVLLASIMQAQTSRPLVELIICTTGILVSIYQIQMASGAKFWQEWWESRVEYFEKLLCKELEIDSKKPHELFSNDPGEISSTVSGKLPGDSHHPFTNHLILRKFSVGRAPIKVGIVLFITWAILLLSTLNFAAFISFLPNIVAGFSVLPAPLAPQ